MIKIVSMLSMFFLFSCSHNRLDDKELLNYKIVFAFYNDTRAVCRTAYRSNCGLILKDCDDGLIHECVTNAVVLDFEEFKKILQYGDEI